MPESTAGSARVWFRAALLGFPAFVALYLSVLVGEILAVGAFGSFLRRDLGPDLLMRVLILMITTLPVAGVTGFAMTRFAPVVGSKAATAAAFLFTVVIVTLQLAVYEPHVTPSSALKILFAVIPIRLGSRWGQRQPARHYVNLGS